MKKVYIYGAGNYGKRLYRFVTKNKLCEIEGFVQTEVAERDKEVYGIPVLSVSKEYENKDDRVRVITTDVDSVAHQYNIGMDEVAGDYIAFLESDDCWHPDMLTNLLSAAESHDVDYVKSDFDMFMGNKDDRFILNYCVLGNKNAELYNQVIVPSDYEEIVHRDINMWNGLYKKSFIDKNKIRLYETEKAAYQDIGFVISILVSDTNNNPREVNGIIVQQADMAEEQLKRMLVVTAINEEKTPDVISYLWKNGFCNAVTYNNCFFDE